VEILELPGLCHPDLSPLLSQITMHQFIGAPPFPCEKSWIHALLIIYKFTDRFLFDICSLLIDLERKIQGFLFFPGE
jgi:hypothetical protein